MPYQGGVVEYLYPGDVLTMKAAAAITGGQVVELTANAMEVNVAGALSEKVIGVALYTVALGEYVSVARVGVYYLTATGAVAPGDWVAAAAAGTVSTIAASGAAYVQAEANAHRRTVGQALDTIANAAKGRIALRIA